MKKNYTKTKLLMYCLAIIFIGIIISMIITDVVIKYYTEKQNNQMIYDYYYPDVDFNLQDVITIEAENSIPITFNEITYTVELVDIIEDEKTNKEFYEFYITVANESNLDYQIYNSNFELDYMNGELTNSVTIDENSVDLFNGGLTSSNGTREGLMYFEKQNENSQVTLVVYPEGLIDEDDAPKFYNDSIRFSISSDDINKVIDESN